MTPIATSNCKGAPGRGRRSSACGGREPDEATLEIAMIGGFAVIIVSAEASVEDELRWGQRADLLGDWLLSEWNRVGSTSPAARYVAEGE